jgi:hypothetical protein
MVTIGFIILLLDALISKNYALSLNYSSEAVRNFVITFCHSSVILLSIFSSLCLARKLCAFFGATESSLS